MAMSVMKGWKELVKLGATFVLVRVKDSQGCDLARTLKVPTGDFFQGASAFVKADSSSVSPVYPCPHHEHISTMSDQDALTPRVFLVRQR